MNEKKIEFMNEKKWNDFDVRPSKIFGYDSAWSLSITSIPVPSVL